MGKNVYAVIMGGGKGERFWPQSRASHPKQLLRLMGNIIVITNKQYVKPMQQLLHKIPADNIIGEYVGRDTAGCLALAAGVVRALGGDDAVMLVSPSDHAIRDQVRFREIAQDAIDYAASSDKLVTLGIKPHFVSTGFGYLWLSETGEELANSQVYAVEKFTEKPDLDAATKCVEAGCRWNSGFFIWKVSAILAALKDSVPEIYQLALDADEAKRKGNLEPVLTIGYENIPKISIDYAVMEKSSNIVSIKADFDWEDVGSWSAMRSQIRASANNNVVRGLYAQLDSSNCCVMTTPTHLVATIDVHDLVIIHTEDATLVCAENSAQRVKELVQELNKNPELKKYL